MPAQSERDVYKRQAQNLVASLFEEESFSEQDIKELRAIFEDKEG